MPATFLWFLFDWRGRLAASPYRIAILALAATVGALHIVPFRNPNLLMAIASAQLFIQASLDAKRLHDVGRSASWVALTSVAGVAIVAKLHSSMPTFAAASAERLSEMIGPMAHEPLVAIVFAGLAGAAALRSMILTPLRSSEEGAVYDHDPLAHIKQAGEVETSNIDADALIARALEDKRLQDAARAMRQAVARGEAQSHGASRKTFGRRGA